MQRFRETITTPRETLQQVLPSVLKMLLPAEQARSAMFQAADAIRRADAGEEGAYALARILTPLLKFRACRDARVVTGDAMEVRGGCGYIEEFSDARLVRDSHLGTMSMSIVGRPAPWSTPA